MKEMDELRNCFPGARTGFGWCALQGVQFEATAYPRTYYPRLVDRLRRGGMFIGIGVICLLGAVSILVVLISSHQSGLFLKFSAAVIGLSSVFLIGFGRQASKSERIVLSPDLMEYKNFSVRRDDIKLVEVKNTRGGRFLSINSARQHPFSIPDIYGRDVLFFSWFSGLSIADLDQMRKEIASTCADPRLGDDAAQRFRTARSARRFAAILTGLSTGAAFILAASNKFLSLWAVAVWPWVLLLLSVAGKGRFTLVPRPGRFLRGNLLFALGVPSVVMLQAPGGGSNVFDLSNWRLAVAGLILGGIWSKLVMATSPREDKEAEVWRWIPGLGTAICTGLISGSALFGLNRTLDHVPATPYSAEVLRKYAVHGKGASYNLKIGPWGPQQLRDYYSVTPWLYDHLNVGDSAQIWLHAGWLGQPWFEISVPPNKTLPGTS